LIAWQKARVLAKKVYDVTRQVGFGQDYGLRDQIRRAVVSVMANLAEGFDRGRRSEFHQFVSIAKSSCAEVRSHLYVALDAGYINQAEFIALKELSDELSRILGGLRSSIARQSSSEKK
jgi:four helix bundle protein